MQFFFDWNRNLSHLTIWPNGRMKSLYRFTHLRVYALYIYPSNIFLARCSSKTNSIMKDPTHPSHSLFQLLPSGRRYRSLRARSARLLNSFFPQAVRALNSDHPALLWNPMQTPSSMVHGEKERGGGDGRELSFLTAWCMRLYFSLLDLTNFLMFADVCLLCF